MPREQDQSANVTDAKALRQVERAVRSTDKAIKQLNRTATALETKFKSLRRAWMQFDKTVKRSVSTQNKAITVQKKMVVGLRQTTRSLKKQNRELRQTTKDSNAASKATKGLLSSLGGIAGLFGIGALGAAAIARVRANIERTFNAALIGGVGSISAIRAQAGGRNVQQALGLVAGFRGQSDFARFGVGNTSGLVKAQQALSGIGFERANRVLLEFTKSLEPKQLEQFLQTAATGDIRRALLQSASGTNINQVTTALNALGIQDAIDKGEAPPELAAAAELNKQLESLTDSFDKLSQQVLKDLLPAIQKLTPAIQSLAEWAGGLSTGQLVGLGAAALLGPSALKGGLRLATRGAGRLLPRLAAPAAGSMAAGGGAAAVPAAALAIPAALAVGGGIAGDKINRDTIRLMEQAQRQNADNRLAIVARANRDNAKNRRQQLIAKRQELAFLASQTSTPMVDQDSSFLDRTLRFVGLVPDLPDQSRQLAQLQEQMRQVNAEIAAIDAGLAENTPVQQGKEPKNRPVVKLMEWIRRGADAARKGVQALGKTLKELEQKSLEANLRRLQQQAAKRAQLELTASEQASLTQLRRIEFQIASTSPFGVAASRAEMERLLSSIRDEIGSLQAILENVDQSTAAGRIESSRVRSEIAQLRLEEKQLNKQWIEALKGLAISEVLGAGGAFRKIILDQNNALEIALRKGIFRDDLPEVTGSIGPSKGLKPRSIKDVIAGDGTGKKVVRQGSTAGTKETLKEQADEMVKNSAKNLEMHKRFAELVAAMEEPDAPEMTRPTRSGGRTSLGTR